MHNAENDKYAKQIRSSAGIAVFVARTADKANWIEVGGCYERLALPAVALGIRNAFVNQPVEVPALRTQFASAVGLRGAGPIWSFASEAGPSCHRRCAGRSAR